MPPNVIVIMTDQHALHAVGCYGAPVCRTPNIDALARDGLRFNRAYTPTALCAPARASIFTGLLPHQHRIRHNEFSDRPDLEYFPRKVRDAGYRLGYAG